MKNTESRVMSSVEVETKQTTSTDGSISERYREAVQRIGSAPLESIAKLETLQKDISSLALFSSNEGLEDISTKSLALLSLEHHLAMASLGIPSSIGQATQRKSRILQSMVLFSVFLQRMEELELLSEELTRDFHELLDSNPEEASQQWTTPGHQREAKIARFRAKQQAQNDLQRLQSTQERRGRLGMEAQDEMDGYDQDSLQRTLELKQLEICATEAVDEWLQAMREIPMIDMAIQLEAQRADVDRHRGTPLAPPDPRPPQSNQPIQLTHITLGATTGQLNIRREDVLSKVFRPSWNQPTMSLEELGDIERAQAIEREAQQKVSEAQQINEPRRYEQLVKDGMEDEHALVDASAELDRKWDDWKDENPRGSGNKMGDRGDRNF